MTENYVIYNALSSFRKTYAIRLVSQCARKS